ncbi:uncharacterized protein LOC120359643 [Solenopsis invicta]|uniref:uncharacterized protein LOC120359643 n=1 Tax=Solenopsis invicta TaxID=13686 RepID=UPI00193CBAA9|nr:uncharacterized protein LOC120359643 [Solenopsis invicta]
MSSNSDTSIKNENFAFDIQNDKISDITHNSCSWIVKHNISHAAANDLLEILKKHNHKSLPKVVRSLMKTPQNVQLNIVPLSPDGKYVHFGLKDGIRAYCFQVTFLERIGGTNAAENVKAILKRIFTNKLGTQCSWLDQRSNFKICDLSVIAIIKDVILSGHNEFQELHFCKAVSEWFRLSTLCLSREHTQVNADNPSKKN